MLFKHRILDFHSKMSCDMASKETPDGKEVVVVAWPLDAGNGRRIANSDKVYSGKYTKITKPISLIRRPDFSNQEAHNGRSSHCQIKSGDDYAIIKVPDFDPDKQEAFDEASAKAIEAYRAPEAKVLPISPDGPRCTARTRTAAS